MSLPDSLQYYVKRLSGYSRNTFRINPTNSDVASANGFIVCDLPTNSIIDFSTLSLNFRAITSAGTGFAALPMHASCLLDSLSIECNGILISSIPSNYGQLWNIVSDITMGVESQTRARILGGATPLSAAPSAAMTSAQFLSITSFLGFLGSVQPRCISTGNCGNIRLRIGLASGNVLVGSANVANPTFNLSDIHMTVDCLSLDESYYNAEASYLAGGGVLEASFNDWYVFSSGALASAASSVKFSLSTGSLNQVLATFVEANSPNLFNGDTGTSTYFRRNTGLTAATAGSLTYQFSVNNVRFGQAVTNAAYAFTNLLNVLGMSEDCVQGMNPNLNSLDRWLQHYWVAAVRFTHDSDGSTRPLVCGLDSRGSVSQMEFIYQGLDTPTTKVAQVYCNTDAILRIGAGRMLDVVK